MNTAKYKSYIGSIAVFLYVSFPMALYAQQKIVNPIKSNSISELLTALLDIIVRLGTPIIVLAFIYSGFLFVKAQGNSEAISEAKRAFTYTAIGAAILLGAAVLAALIDTTIKDIL